MLEHCQHHKEVNMAYRIVSKYGKGIGTGQVAKENEEKLRQDAAFRTSERERAMKVIADRKAAGEDISPQEAYLKRIEEYDSQAMPTLGALDNVLDGNKSNEELGANRLSPTVSGLDEISKAQSDIKIRNLEAAFEQGATAREGEERASIEQKQRTDKAFADFIASRPETGLGAQQRIQSDIALGSNLASIDRRGSEAQAQLGLNIANVKDQAAVETLQRAEQAAERAFETELATIGRYANDFLAEIERRRATPDTNDDRLIPYLESAQADKMASESALPSYPQALEAYRLGVRSPEVMQVLNASGFEVSTGGTGGSRSSSTTGPTPDQKSAYLAFWNNYFNNPAWANDPQGIISTITSDKTIIPQIGEELYDQLLSDAMSFAQGYKPPEPTIEEPTFAETFNVTDAYTVLNKLKTLEQIAVQLDDWASKGVPQAQLDDLARSYGIPIQGRTGDNFAPINFGITPSPFRNMK